MITRCRDSVATFHHNRDGGDHQNFTGRVQHLRSPQLIEVLHTTCRACAGRVRGET